jgi:D-alanyl-lipoteichoic acid acyltransferase DltB (MBOAT superfamily)
MLFYTPEFLAFSLILLVALGIAHRDTPRKILLLIASYVFYMWWNPAFILLIVFTTAVSFVVGSSISRTDDRARRRALLTVGVAASLSVLGFFKYADFVQDNTLVLLRQMGFEVHWTTLNIILPVGISFYTFQCLSYTIDVYRRRIPPAPTPLDFALYVAFFPQLVAGPIVRAADFLPQLRGPIRIGCDQRAFFLIMRGLAKKVFVADNLAILVDGVFADPSQWPSSVIWIAAACFGVQIYCDFSGYSDIAIGVARVLGFEIPRNFDHPYAARNPSDFWRRWHISLSSWLRDYLYIPLGGNRYGRLLTYRNLMLTMLLGGLWHGASWNFVLWGFLHGLILVVHRAYVEWRVRRNPLWAPSDGFFASLAGLVAMQYCVLVTWITFRITDFGAMWVALRRFVLFDFDFRLAGLGLGELSFFSSLVLLGAFLALHVFSFRRGHIHVWLGRVGRGPAALVCFAFGFAAFCLWPLSEAPFIYFQF